jgi:hypothetical protein
VDAYGIRCRRHWRHWLGTFLLTLAVLAAGRNPASASSPSQTTGLSGPVALARLPLHFEANYGQTDASVKFLARGRGCTLFLAPDEVVLNLRSVRQQNHGAGPSETGQLAAVGLAYGDRSSTTLRLRLVGANSFPRVTGLEELPGRVNYFKGNDPSNWRTNVATYARVKYENVYPGIDLVFYGSNEQQLEFDFVVGSGANPNSIKLAFEGADQVETDADGNLGLLVAGEIILLHKPRLYQMNEGRLEEVVGSYLVREASSPYCPLEVGFQVAAYDLARQLVIDPVLSYSTYLGGSGYDVGMGIAVDTNGYAYVVGFTQSPDFPTTNALDSVLNDTDAFVVKLKPDGSGFVYSTYLGGSYGDLGNGIATDAAGNAYVTGVAGSLNFPVVNGFQASAGGWKAFVTKLNSNGSAILYSTYLGGTGDDRGVGIAVDGVGGAYVTGSTSSTNFPTRNAVQPDFHGGGTNNPYNYKGDAFVAKIDTTATGSASLVYSTYLGGNDDDAAKGIAVDAAGNAYVTGYTASTNFPVTVGVFQSAYAGGDYDAFVAKLDPSGTALVYSTYLGGSANEGEARIAVDAHGCAYVAGDTGSSNFPTTRNAYVFSREGFAIYLSMLSGDGSSLVYSARLPGAHCYGVAVDTAGSAFVVGDAFAASFPLVNPVQSSFGGGSGDASILRIAPDGDALIFSSYLGGSADDQAISVAVDPGGNAYVAGYTSSTNFPTLNAMQPSFGGGAADAFIAKLPPDADTTAPNLIVARNSGAPTWIELTFSKPVSEATATNAANYTLDNGALVQSAAIGSNSKSVVLTTTPLVEDVDYTLTVNAIQDRVLPTPNTLLPNTQMRVIRTQGCITRKEFDNLPGWFLSTLTNSPNFPNHPDVTDFVTSLEWPPDARPGFGLQLAGFLTPPVTDDYVLYIASDTQSALFLSTDDHSTNKQLIAWVTGRTDFRQWNVEINQQSAPIHLEAGRHYYIEALLKRGSYTPTGHASVAWRRPGDPAPANGDPPISFQFLSESRFVGPVQITSQPADQTVDEHQAATLSVTAEGTPPLDFQWFKNGAPITGAKQTRYLIPSALAADAGVFNVVVSNSFGAVPSSNAVLVVVADAVPPTLLSAEGNLGLNRVTLRFSEPINALDATNIANYALSGGLAVTNAILRADRTTVFLDTGPQTGGTTYSVTVNGIRDTASAANVIARDSQVSFIAYVSEEFVGPFSSWADLKRDYGAVGDGVADDTAALQRALDEVGNLLDFGEESQVGHPHAVYVPAGTYRITRGLVFKYRASVSLVGEDPATTIIKWDGADGGIMLWSNGVTEHRVTRFTFDGAGRALSAIDHKWDGTTQPGATTGSEYSDLIIQDVEYGIRAGVASNDAEVAVLRCHFLRCSQAGISMESYNALDWWAWYCQFEDCRLGVTNIRYAGQCHVYGSVFKHSTEADIAMGNGSGFFSFRNNTSIGSRAFFSNGFIVCGGNVTIQGNTIIDPQDPTPIQVSDRGPVLLFDNIIKSRDGVTNGPVVSVWENLVSIGNTFTVKSPLQAIGNAITLNDRMVEPGTLDLVEPELPGPLPNRHRSVTELQSGTNALSIQQAITAAAQLAGQRPVVHLPAGAYHIDRTIEIPPGSDVQLVGDGVFSTKLNWTGEGTGPVIRLAGPARATLRELSVNGGRRADGIVVENCDQPQARVFMEHADTSGFANNLVVDRLDHTLVEIHASMHGFSTAVSYKVVGGPLLAAGQPATGRVNCFGSSGGNSLFYEVLNGGRLLVEDNWFESGQPTFMRLTNSGVFTLHGAMIAVPDATHGGTVADPAPAVDIRDFRGRATFLTTYFYSPVQVAGDGQETKVLLLGVVGSGFGVPGNTNAYLINNSNDAAVGLLASLQATAGGGAEAVPDQGRADAAFILEMLEQTRVEKPHWPTLLPPGVTDVRLYRIIAGSGRIGIKLTGTNAPPQLAATPDQVVDEGVTLSLTNIVTDGDLPYQTLSFSLLPGVPYGASVNPTNAVFTWTPREEQGPGTNFIQVVVTDDGSPPLGATNSFSVVVREINTPPQLGVLDPATILQAGDIGTLGDPLEPGSSVLNPDGSITVQAGGSGLWANDAFHFTYLKVTGDFDVRVRIVSQEPRDAWSFAGLMARESMDANSQFYAIGTWPAGPTLDGVWGEGKDTYNTICRETLAGGRGGWGPESPGVPYPNAWLRFKREGDTFSAFRGTNGLDWTPLASRTVLAPFRTELFLGLATYSYNNSPGQTTRVEYGDYGPYPPPPPSPFKDWSVNEGDTLTFSAPVYDLDVPFELLAFKLGTDAPAGASIDPATGVFVWTPSEAQGPGIYPITIIVTDNGTPPLSDSNSFTVTVGEVNTAPELSAVPAQTLDELTALGLTLAATDPDVPTTTLTFGLVRGPSGLTVSPAGAVAWTPAEEQGPSTNVVVVKVTDDGTPALSATNSFTVIVIESNSPPVMTVPGTQSLDESTSLVVTNTATDPDLPPNVLAFALVSVPTGVNLDPTTGVLTWTPTEAQGPSTNTIAVSVTDDGQPSLGVTNSFTVVVLEANSAPVLTVPLDQTIAATKTLTVTNLATDPDIPPNLLTFALVSAPTGVNLEPVTGVLTWTPTEAQGPSTNTITVRVTDDGSPVLSATNSFKVGVTAEQEPLKVSIALSANGSFTMSWPPVSGKTYTVQYKNGLSDPAWIAWGEPSAETSVTLSTTNGSARFYRIVQGD